ncbi:MAG TPA: carboxypeptidase regulatory-like domain-containing protein, partial [Polyangia bacterium]|nr:carboxypeptidase regulatory-like domain-containing protein [Polyangia bacterium]
MGLALLAIAGSASAQETTGRVTGRVTDQDTGLPLGGVTVIVVGPQGEDAVVTSDRGEYTFTSLPVGTYVIRFYAANTTTQVEQSGVRVDADKMVRVNAKISGTAAAAAAQQTYLITTKAPTIDIGSARVGAQFDSQFTHNVPLGLTYGDIIERAPGAFVDGSGNVSIGGATGLENIYLVNGMNVTGLRYGNLESGAASIGGGSNLPIEFLTQIDVNSGGYQAEYGGAMGGVVNTVFKSGSNEFHGSVFGYWSPFWLSANPSVVLPADNALTGVKKPDFDDNFGVEVGGPIIKDKLFFWLGFSPQITNDHVLRLTYAQQEDPNNPGQPLIGANGLPVIKQTDWTARIPETHRTYYYAGTLDWIPLPDNKLNLTISGTPSFNQEVKSQYGINSYASDPQTAVEDLTRANTDVSAHWTSKLFDRRWQIDALAGMHSEYLYGRSPYSQLNNINEVQYAGANLWDAEHANGCAPDPVTGFQPCPLLPYYQTGGFGEIDKYTGYRWTGEIKSTHELEAAGHHEVKWGWHLEVGTFDLNRAYSGTAGDHAFEQVFFPGNISGFPGNFYQTTTFFNLPPGESPAMHGDLTMPPDYVDGLHSYAKSLSNAFFLQDSYSPEKLRNLTINAGVRLELQKLYGAGDYAFLDTSNWSPRLAAVYDPFNDGRSKLSVSYGRYYEEVPLDLAARYFGGENFVAAYGPLANCATSNGYGWSGAGESQKCGAPAG